MPMAGSKSITLGFLHVRRRASTLFRAGYLLTTDFGRPIEFHYTSEVSVPLIHQTIFGADFEPHFFVDTLAKPMTDRQSVAPQLIVVSSRSLLGLRRLIPAPVVSVDVASDDPFASAHAHEEFGKDLAIFEKVRGMVSGGFDWREPFERIESALAEIGEPTGARSAA
jgi:hypothetical protein